MKPKRARASSEDAAGRASKAAGAHVGLRAKCSPPTPQPPPPGTGVMLTQGWQGQGVLRPVPLSLGLPEPGAYLVNVVDRLTHRPGTDAGTQKPGCYF